jgi:NAD(P)-dependent dehydrogenase (short-subunit alcohol dehydrogenase family)
VEITICMTVPGMRVEAMKDVTVLVTGASGGIGRLLAKRLRERGFLVIGWDMKPDSECDPLPVDVGNWESVQRAAESLPDCLGAVVNCAGAGLRGAFVNTSMADFDSLMRVNVTGTAHVAAVTHSRLTGGGAFVAVGSVAAQVPMADRSAYCASKAAVAMLSRCLASEWAADGIQVVCVNPGFMDVGMAASSSSSGETSLVDVLARTPTGRLVPADQLLDVFELLVSGKMRGIAGSEITVDEGFTAGWRTTQPGR